MIVDFLLLIVQIILFLIFWNIGKNYEELCVKMTVVDERINQLKEELSVKMTIVNERVNRLRTNVKRMEEDFYFPCGGTDDEQEQEKTEI